MTVSDRAEILKLMGALFERAKVETPPLPREREEDLSQLFSTKAFGFREIALLIVLARLRDKTYKPSTTFYACNPRPFYEQAMADFLVEKDIPHMKSGPLNVAKATLGLDQSWAAQRRPAAAGNAVVRLAKYVESANESDLKNLGVRIMKNLQKEATRIEGLKTELAPDADPIVIEKVCRRLIEDAPDSGNTPQRIIGLLIECYHDHLKTGIKVSGHLDRASVTNTTSKKPGDITEEKAGIGVTAVYEVTVKKFDDQRVKESHQAIQAYNTNTKATLREAIVICRKDDVNARALEWSTGVWSLQQNGTTYYFQDIFQWISQRLINMPAEARRMFVQRLNAYINAVNTAETVKKTWSTVCSALVKK